jgi:serine kinase of HPr protein (carbohydrate metabolism regulator)
MSPAPCRKIPKKKPITLTGMLRDCLPALGFHHIFAEGRWSSSSVGAGVQVWRSIARTPRGEGAVVILSAEARDRLLRLSRPLISAFFRRHSACKTALLVFARSEVLPEPLAVPLRRLQLPAAVSSYHENLLESRIKAAIREKIRKTVERHGVAIATQGGGILITGPSGVGKTTAALGLVSREGFWIADDLAVIRQDAAGRLMLSGHAKIRKYLHTSEAGLVEVDQILEASRIRKKARLAALVEVVRSGRKSGKIRAGEATLLGVGLPRIQIAVSASGYLHENLLSEAIKKIREVG